MVREDVRGHIAKVEQDQSLTRSLNGQKQARLKPDRVGGRGARAVWLCDRLVLAEQEDHAGQQASREVIKAGATAEEETGFWVLGLGRGSDRQRQG